MAATERTGVKVGPFKTADISGFGGGYEDLCQKMLWRGVAYLAEAKPPTEMWEQAASYRNVYGVLKIEGEDLKRLEKAIMRDEEGASGAMHQAVMGHIAYIHLHGQDAWLEELRKHRGEDGVGEWEGEL